MNLVDNLLVLNNLTEHLSLFYDIKNSNPVHTVGSPQSIYVMMQSINQMGNGIDLIVLKIKLKRIKKKAKNLNLKSLLIKKILFVRKCPLQPSNSLLDLHSTKPMDYSLLIDINKRQIFTYEIDAEQVRTLLKDEVNKNLLTLPQLFPLVGYFILFDQT